MKIPINSKPNLMPLEATVPGLPKPGGGVVSVAFTPGTVLFSGGCSVGAGVFGCGWVREDVPGWEDVPVFWANRTPAGARANSNARAALQRLDLILMMHP
jgi:hypothetical protein